MSEQYYVFSVVCEEIPLAESNVYLADKTLIGTVHEVLGPINQVVCRFICKKSYFKKWFSMKPLEPNSGKEYPEVYMNPQRLRPLNFFIPPPPANPYPFSYFVMIFYFP